MPSEAFLRWLGVAGSEPPVRPDAAPDPPAAIHGYSCVGSDWAETAERAACCVIHADRPLAPGDTLLPGTRPCRCLRGSRPTTRDCGSWRPSLPCARGAHAARGCPASARR
jgi:hypothetical protein